MIKIYGKTGHNGDEYGFGSYDTLTALEAIMKELQSLRDTKDCVELSAFDDHMNVWACRDGNTWEVHMYVEPNGNTQESWFTVGE